MSASLSTVIARGHLDRARGYRVVDRALGTVPNRSFDAHDVLGANAVCSAGKSAGRIVATDVLGIDHHLHDPGGITEIDEQDATVIAPVVDPAAQHHVAPDVVGAEIARAIGSHHRVASGSVVRRLCSHAATAVREISSCSPERRSFTATAARSSSARPSMTP